MSNVITKSVEEWVRGVDYSNDVNYVPSKFALEFINFIKMVNGGEGEENKSPVLHYKILDQLIGKNRYVANMIHRGAAKTTIMEYLFLYLGVYGGELPGFGRIELAIYVSDSIDNGVKNMRKNLESRWENSDFLQRYLPNTKFTDIEWTFTNLEGKKFIVKGYGAKTGVRGTKSQGKRPKLAIMDDIISDDDARSATVIATIEDTVHKAIDYAMHPTSHKVIWSGTPFNASDPLYKAVESGAWAVNVYPVCETFPCKREDFRGSWEDRFTYDYVKDKYDKAVLEGNVAAFNQELMLRIMSDEDRLVSDSDINWYNSKVVHENKDSFNFYITTDFATSEKQSADYSFISVWAYNNNGDWYWVDGVCRRQLMDANIDDLFRLVHKYNPMSVGIEITGQQGGFIPWIQQEMAVRNIFFNLAKNDNATTYGLRPTTDKLQRFNVVVPWFKQGKMFFPEDLKSRDSLKEMMTEITLASVSGFKSKHDDAIDTISMLAALKAWKPTTPVKVTRDSNNVYQSDVVEAFEYSINNYIV